MSPSHTPFLIVGAGPFGLAMAAWARELGVEHALLGEPMSFWREHMPAGMRLRSGCDWHLDPRGEHTLVRFLAERGTTPGEAEPLPLALYLEYAAWFEAEAGVAVERARATGLRREGGRFRVELAGGGVRTADRVLLALGFAPFAHVPEELAARVPGAASSHSRDLVDPARFAGKRVLVVGGRQSAFESAALLAEAGARTVHVCHRHDTPRFTGSDWSWVLPALERIADDPAGFRAMPAEERRALDARFWSEGRLKLEPWLAPRLRRDEIRVRPGTGIADVEARGSGLRVRLEPGGPVDVDHVLYATGYRVDLARVELLRSGGWLERIRCVDGLPELDDTLQCSVPGLHFTSLPATRSFGSFFAFTAAVRTSARLVGAALA